MPYNGSGTFTLVTGNPVVTGTVINSTVHNNTQNDIAAGLTNVITRDGQSVPFGNLPMGGFKHTGAADATVSGQYVVQGQSGASLDSLTVNGVSTEGNATTLRSDLLSSSGSAEVGFIQAGVGAVARTAQAKLRDFVSITDFGADPAGVADSRAALVAALAAHNSVYVPAGTFRINGDTVVVPDNKRLFGAGKYASSLVFYPGADKDGLQVGWYTTVEDLRLRSEAPGGGVFGVLRMQSLTNPEIPTNVGGNNWTDPAIGGLSYKNDLRNLVIENGQNYNVFSVNPAYVNIENVRSVLARGAGGNLYVWGKGGGPNFPEATTVRIVGGEYTASTGGPGIQFKNAAVCNVTGAKVEGNKNRGLLLDTCVSLTIDGEGYVENNFALGAPLGDGDITVINSTNVKIADIYILQNNSTYAVLGSGNTSCSLSNVKYNSIVGGPLVAGTISLDAGWVDSLNAFSIHSAGLHSSGGRWVRFSDGTATFSKTVSWTGNISTGAGSLFVSAAIVDTDFPAIFRVRSGSDLDFETALHVLADSTSYIGVVAQGTSTLNNAIRYTLTSPVTKTALPVVVQISMRGRWK